MIKRIHFATRQSDVSADAFSTDWPGAVAGAAHAPPDVRPARVAVCVALPDLTPDPRHDGIGIEWFADAGHLGRFQEWLDTGDGHQLTRRLAGIVRLDASPVVVADESVLRGADWLVRRWRGGGARLKHMAIALRADTMSPAEFARRWRGRAGRLGRPGSAVATIIPADARGHAYVQNHPLARTSGEWAYDALNEVYFEDLAGLLRRIEWFRENLRDGAEDDLVRRSWFIAGREEIVS